MTPRERFVATLTFGSPDRIPFAPGFGRLSTHEAWRRQGLPAHVTDIEAYVRELAGVPPEPPAEQISLDANFRMIPEFEERVLERRPPPSPGARGTLVVRDWKGNVCEISDEFDATYLRNSIDFVTRSWIRCPVESRADWSGMTRRYDPADPRRLPADFAARAERLRDRPYVLGFNFSGPFWQLREWLGFENLCVLLLDDPDFAQEMIGFWRDFISGMLARILPLFRPDFVRVDEDMAYKGKPMIGPEMVRRFLMPCWRAWADQIRGAGVPLFELDSDGHVGLLLPLFIEAGFNLNTPLEVAAGNDLPAYRRLHGTRMAYRGGVDKRAMAAGGGAIERELARLKPAIDAGGFIPSCDHGVPPDVSWPNFVRYSRLLAKATGWT
jgi:uroporphyrinogen decarboxylase